ncbi:MAG: hypothetical protein EOO43_01230 [Flavobacterium sp.]|nr:MAG: hypothetical protein EOO43_01230 [Flavobacterium sp.]
MKKNVVYIDFCNDELFTYEEFETFLDSNPIKKGEMLSNRLLPYLVVCNDVTYFYDYRNVTYRVVQQPKLDYLSMIVRKLVVMSYEAFSAKEKKSFRGYNLLTLFKLEYFNDFILDVYNMITNDTIVFDRTEQHIIHYRNGYYDVKQNRFHRRDPEIHFITQYVNEDFKVKRSQMQYDDEEDQYDCCDNEEVVFPAKLGKKQFSKSEIKRISAMI